MMASRVKLLDVKKTVLFLINIFVHHINQIFSYVKIQPTLNLSNQLSKFFLAHFLVFWLSKVLESKLTGFVVFYFGQLLVIQLLKITHLLF